MLGVIRNSTTHQMMNNIGGEIMKRAGLLLATAFCAVMWSATAQGQVQQGTGTVSLTGFTTVSENFNTLAAAGTATLDTAPATGPVGWYALEAGTAANNLYTASTGSATTGDTYSYGSAAVPADRAFGTLQSNALIPIIGAQFTNNTGSPIGSVTISYRGEEWRLGAISRTDQLDFQYSTNATSLSTGTWLDANPLDFVTPNTTAPTGIKDGNAAGNFTNLGPVSILFASPIANGGTFWIRWVDLDITGSEDGLAVDEFALTPSAPTAVKLTSFTATYTNDGVLLNWKSGYEVENLGYHVYRQQNGKRTRVTPSMIAGSALLAGERTVLTAGYSYSWFDRIAADRGSVSYWLEDVDTNGKRTLRGPVTPANRKVDRQQAAQAARLDQLAVDAASAQQEWATSWDKQRTQLNKGAAKNNTSLVRQQDVVGKRGVKIMVRQPGWVRVHQAELTAAGLGKNLNASLLQLFADGREVPIIVSDNNHQGRFTTGDWIEFYGHGLDLPTTDTRTYYLTVGTSAGKRILRSMAPTGSSGTQARSFSYTVERKERSIFFTGLNNGDEENFFGQIITTTPVESSLMVQRLDRASTSAQLRVTLQGVTAVPHQVTVQLNDANVGTMSFDGRERKTESFTINTSQLRRGNNIVRLVAAGGETDVSLLDAVRLIFAHNYMADNNRLQFSVASGAPVSIGGFNAPNIRIVDITNYNAVQELTPVVKQQGGLYTATLRVAGARAQNVRTLLAFVDHQVDSPAAITKNEPSNLADVTNSADFLIITERSLRQSLQPLAQLRRSQFLQVSIIDVEDIYDEFSYGEHSPQALRDFLGRAYLKWQHGPQHVLFAGDATYDPRNYLGQGHNDLVPTKLLYVNQMETASDDWLVDFNNDGVPEFAIGRLPVRTNEEAARIINRIVSFTPGSTVQRAVLVADRNDEYNDFEAASQGVQSMLPPTIQVDVINRGNQDTSTVRSQIIGSINQGAVVVNYYGHGSVGLWTGAGLLNTTDASALTNGTHLPVFTLMTCLNGFFHDASGESMSEALLKAEQGGAIAVWASSGLTEMSGQALMSQEMYAAVFGQQFITLGEAARAAKEATQDQGVRRSWIFFGDPSMRLR